MQKLAEIELTEPVHHRVVDTSPRVVKELRGALAGLNMEGYKRVLDLLELVVPNDRVFQKARQQVLDIAGQQTRTIQVTVTRLIEDALSKETDDNEASVDA